MNEVSRMQTSPKSNRAFTLIELLTVIAIIAILVGLLFPAIKSAMLKAETTKAQVQISNLQTAFKSYYTEYGHWPVGDTVNTNNTYTVDTNFVALLQGSQNTASLTGGGALPPFSPVATSTLQGNPRQIHFLEFKQAEIDPKLGYVDPWKTPYYCKFDVTYANDVNDPFSSASPANKIKAGFIIWSAGPNGQYDASDTPTGPSLPNKDNLKSW